MLGLPLFLAVGLPATAQERPYTTARLGNGLTVVAMESHKVPLVTIVLAAKAGAMTETPDINGLTHLWEHMFFKGNRNLPDQEAFNKKIRELGIVYNGDTAAEKVRYYFTLPSAFLDQGVSFMADAIQAPLLEPKELEKERHVVLNEYERDAAQPSFDFMNLERNIIYGKQEYLRDALGLRPIIESATRQQLLQIKDKVFVPANVALLIAGDFKPAQLQGLVMKYFANWRSPKGWKAVKPPHFPPFPHTTAFVMTRPNVENANISLTFPGPKARTERTDSYAADILVSLLEQRSGRFYRKFVDSGLTYQAGLSYYTQSQAGETEVYAMSSPKNAEKVHKLLLDEVKQWAKPGYFTQTQLDDVHRKLTISRKREVNQPTEYVKTLAFWWAVTGFDYYDNYIPNMRKTGLKEVRAFVTKYLLGKPHIDGILLSPQDAQKVGLKDTSKALAAKYLSMYKTSAAATQRPTPTPKG